MVANVAGCVFQLLRIRAIALRDLDLPALGDATRSLLIFRFLNHSIFSALTWDPWWKKTGFFWPPSAALFSALATNYGHFCTWNIIKYPCLDLGLPYTFAREGVSESNKHECGLVGYIPGGKAMLLLYQISRFGEGALFSNVDLIHFVLDQFPVLWFMHALSACLRR